MLKKPEKFWAIVSVNAFVLLLISLNTMPALNACQKIDFPPLVDFLYWVWFISMGILVSICIAKD